MNIDDFFTQAFWQEHYWDNSLIDYLNAVVIFIGTIFVVKLLQLVALKRFEKLTQKSKNNIDNKITVALKSIKAPFYMIVSVWFASRSLTLNLVTEKIISISLFVILTITAIRFTEAIVKTFLSEITQKNKQAKPLLHFFSIAIRLILWIFGIAFVLSSLGINVSSFITGLGISGIILALTLQNVMLDLFNSLTLYLDKPIQIGDKISIGNDAGIVQKIGIKSTRIKSADGQIIVIPNRNLTTSSISNFQNNNQRRILNIITIPHNSTDEQCHKAIGSIQQLLNLAPGISINHVSITDFNDQGLKLEIDYQFQNINNEAEFLAQKQTINLEIRQALKKAGVVTQAK